MGHAWFWSCRGFKARRGYCIPNRLCRRSWPFSCKNAHDERLRDRKRTTGRRSHARTYVRACKCFLRATGHGLSAMDSCDKQVLTCSIFESGSAVEGGCVDRSVSPRHLLSEGKMKCTQHESSPPSLRREKEPGMYLDRNFLGPRDHAIEWRWPLTAPLDENWSASST